MKFLSFTSQEERRKFGGSCFLEMQFCRISGTERELVAISNVGHWQNDSLYICADDMNEFYGEYGSIFDCGIYGNLKSGVFDMHGINYYHAGQVEPIIQKLQDSKLADYAVAAAWLKKARSYNGFYILGV